MLGKFCAKITALKKDSTTALVAWLWEMGKCGSHVKQISTKWFWTAFTTLQMLRNSWNRMTIDLEDIPLCLIDVTRQWNFVKSIRKLDHPVSRQSQSHQEECDSGHKTDNFLVGHRSSWDKLTFVLCVCSITNSNVTAGKTQISISWSTFLVDLIPHQLVFGLMICVPWQMPMWEKRRQLLCGA